MKQVLQATSQRDLASKDFVDLDSAVAALPTEFRSQLEPLVQRAIENSTRRRRILSLVQDALGQLRLDMKYLMFDLEATRASGTNCVASWPTASNRRGQPILSFS